MKTESSPRFKKKYEKLDENIKNKFKERLRLFLESPLNPILKVHALRGNLIGHKAFSITGDFRAIYTMLDKETIKLVDIGTHNQVYK